ncbi:TonB-dependent receptor [Cellulophaga sp. HaHa_2_1]|uniref:TonB-dependent receptor n=1 Tax=Cellulophaga sp. HaHa_2_1 TaxID=2749994 RepID=UPI001C4F7544|nr:TonB-dependent receptor [Cellulophaga sp. HaHa_2_1]QXP51015.1 TonB-dependent receptor [Cellulophaga sp. HaHa_2_1]
MKKTLSLGILTLMRIFLLFITIGLSSAYANLAMGQNKMDVELNNLSVEQFFSEIQSTSNYIFFYKDDVIGTNKKISLKLKNVKISTVLDKAFSNTNLTYKIEGKQIVVKKVESRAAIKNISNDDTSVQEKIITGTVYGTDGIPLVGVNILVKGTTQGTQTDFDGHYAINANDTDVLAFSYIGMLTQTAAVGAKTVIDITLKENAAALEEVVLVGYGSQKKESLTGSVGVVKSATFEQAPVSSFEQALRGSTAGLQASAVDGAPGGNTQVRIRGIGSISASSEPLYVIDGIPIQNGSIGTIDNGGSSTNVMASINPNDIESISVLKDAASTAIYGSRGANGVILITTKSGKSGKAKITLKTLTGFNSQAYNNILKPLNAAEYTELFLEGYVNGGDTAAEAQARFDATFQQLIDPSTGEPTDTNWLDAITRTGITQSYDLSASGGTDNLKYFFSGAYYDQENYIIGSGFKRLSARSNIEFKATDYLTISNNISVSNSTTNTFFDGGSFNNPFKNSLELSPLIPIYDDEGRFNGEHADYFPLGGANPVGALSGDDLWENKQFRVIDNFAVSIKPIKNLTLRSQLNFDLLTLNESQYQNPRYGGGRNSGGIGYDANTSLRTFVGTQTADYNFILGDNHNFNVLGGFEAQETNNESFSASGTQFPNQSLRTLNSASAEFAISGSKSEYTFVSAFSRLNYNYDGKYFLSGSLRRDGSSRFGADNRWGTFYSFGGSWVASRESFLEDVSFLDLLKVRSSWGVTGNAAIGNFPSQGLYVFGQDYDGNPGGSPSQIANPDLTWESQQNFNIGVDFGLFSKISGTVEYFERTSSDLILNVPITLTSGFSSLTQNFGEMKNSGLEISMNADIISKKDFTWNVGFNTTFLKNEITELTDDFTDGAYRRQEGEDFQSFYLYSWAGVNQENGDPQWYTDASKTTITNDISDAERFLDDKSATPEFFGGFNTMFTYKDISLSANFIYSYGNYIFDSRARGTLGDGRLTPRSTADFIYDNRWQPGSTDALVPQFVWGGRNGSNEANQTRWLYDGSYIRLRDLTVSYNFTEKITSLLGLNSMRLYARGTNILTFVKEDILYIDPEQGINGSYTGQTPAVKTVSIGLDIQL